MTDVEWHEHIVIMAEGNPGAATILADLYMNGRYDIIEELFINDVTGSRVWILWDICGMWERKMFKLLEVGTKEEITNLINLALPGKNAAILSARGQVNQIIVDRVVEQDNAAQTE